MSKNQQNIFLKLLGIKQHPKRIANTKNGVFQKQFSFPTKTLGFKVHEKLLELISGNEARDFLWILYQRLYKALPKAKRGQFRDWELYLTELILNTPWSNDPLTDTKAQELIDWLVYIQENPESPEASE